jgi:2-hydroxychromene-2-carboxylate isomerase
MDEREEIKMYSDYKSPYAFLALDPAYELEARHRVRVRWIPFQLRIKGKGERSEYSELKVRYSYVDARRWANRRGGIVLKGPRKIYDTTPALIGGLFAEAHGQLRAYSQAVYTRFFRRELEIDEPDAVAGVIAELGLSAGEYRSYLAGDGLAAYERAQEEARADGVFGVPLFLFRGEQFWGNDRIEFLESRLVDAGLARATPTAT